MGVDWRSSRWDHIFRAMRVPALLSVAVFTPLIAVMPEARFVVLPGVLLLGLAGFFGWAYGPIVRKPSGGAVLGGSDHFDDAGIMVHGVKKTPEFIEWQAEQVAKICTMQQGTRVERRCDVSGKPMPCWGVEGKNASFVYQVVHSGLSGTSITVHCELTGDNLLLEPRG